MITINHPSVQTEGNAVTISYPILQDGHAPRTLSFTVDSRFRDFLNPGRADGALVALLPWISQQSGQVRVLPAISAHLYHFGLKADESSAGILLKKTVWNSSGWIHPCTIFMATRDI